MNQPDECAKVIVDCDPGVDDAIALMCALAPARDFSLLAVTAVAGNMPLPVTFENARLLTAFLGRPDLPVFAGADRPLVREATRDAVDIHGGNGLGGWEAGVPVPPASGRSAADFIVGACRSEPVTLCPVGPLTTIAQVLQRAPDLAGKLPRVVLMGGAGFVPGNVTEAAEFNIWADPDAAALVFAAPVEKVMIGLDVTLQVAADEAWIAGLSARGGRYGMAAAAMLGGYKSRSKALHDPCVPVYLERPDLFDGERCRVEVVTTPGPDYGRTIATPDAAGDTLVLTKVDAAAVRQHVADAIAALDRI